jgi:CheY-like chemotaxis protein
MKSDVVTLVFAGEMSLSASLLRASLEAEGYCVIQADGGRETLAILGKSTTPAVGIIDEEMSGFTGLEVCRLARQAAGDFPLYLILVTNRTQARDIVAGLSAGADDCVAKPWNHSELKARVKIGILAVEERRSLLNRIHELEDLLKRAKTTGDALPICCYCKKIRDQREGWQQIEMYLQRYFGIRFSHGICPDCFDREVRPELDEMKSNSWRRRNIGISETD